MNELVERLKKKRDFERAMWRDPPDYLEDAIAALEAADKLVAAIDGAVEKAGVKWISPRIAWTRNAYRTATQKKD